MCGADSKTKPPLISCAGSSPRVRSRQWCALLPGRLPGIISACAEQTLSNAGCPTRRRDHLRVCGADSALSPAEAPARGSSPRVRSRLDLLGELAGALGIISACAEQTTVHGTRRPHCWDHLRVCGADTPHWCCSTASRGSSPRVRSRRKGGHDEPSRYGIISACAEQTTSQYPTGAPRGDHLRVCGADAELGAAGEDRAGSSPRVRSRRRLEIPRQSRIRIISACAEQTRSCQRSTVL